MSRSSRFLKFVFGADTADAMRDTEVLEESVRGVGEAARRSGEELRGATDGVEVSAKEASAAMRKLGITSEQQADRNITNLERQVEVVREAFEQGNASAGDLRRTQERLIQQQQRWARLTGRSIENGVERPLERVQRKLRNIGDGFQRVGKRVSGISAASGVALAGIGAGVGAVARSGQEISVAARSAGIDVSNDVDLEKFQRLAFAANASFGAEVDKTGDVLKDLNDKLGDFRETGAGPFVDFFEQVAPDLGLVDQSALDAADSASRQQILQNAATQFLGDTTDPLELLQKYVTAIEATDPNAQKIAFYMEAIASDSVLFFELLKDSGAELKRLGDIGAETDGFFSADDLKILQDAREEMAVLRLALAGVILQLAESGLIESFAEMLKSVTNIALKVTDVVGPGFMSWTVGILAATTALAPFFFVLGKIFAAVSGVFGLFSASAIGGLLVTGLKIAAGAVLRFVAVAIAGILGVVGAVPATIAVLLISAVWLFRDKIIEVFKWIGGKISQFFGWITGASSEEGINGNGFDAVVEATTPRDFGEIPAELQEVGQLAKGGTINFDQVQNGETYSMTTDLDTYERLSEDINKRRTTQTMRAPRFARG